MNLNRNNMLKIIFIIFVSIVLFTAAQNYEKTSAMLGTFINVLAPFIIGLCIAFIINVPMHFFETKVFAKLNQKGNKIWLRIRRPLCLIISLLVILGVLTVLMLLIIPGIRDTIISIAADLPERTKVLANTVNEWFQQFNLSLSEIASLEIDWESISSTLVDTFTTSGSTVLHTTIDLTSGIIRSLFNFVMGFVFSIYLLLSKEKLVSQLKKVSRALFKDQRTESIFDIIALTNKIFSKFVIGQCTEAVILGTLCYIGMLIFRMPYAILISSMITVTAFIPMFGAFIGTAIGALMILLVNPIQAVWFVLFIIVLQQLEGNIIYPKVVGNSIGLPGIWVLVAVTIGGSLFGAVGMLVSVPLCAVLYCLAREFVYARLRKKEKLSLH